MTTFPQHHLPPEVLLEYASGTTVSTTSLLVACHLALCPSCRREVARLEEIGGQLIAEQPAAPLVEGALERALTALEQTKAPVPARPLRQFEGLEGVTLPAPLHDALPGGTKRLSRWLPGVKGALIPLDPALPPARLALFQPGIRIPLHDHAAPEYVLVLEGELMEGETRFRRGDVACSEVGHQHEQRIAPTGSCLALVVNEGPIVPRTLWGQILKRLAGL